MLWTLAILFILIWGLGLATSYTLGVYLHVLVGLTVVLLLLRIIRGGRREEKPKVCP